MDLEVLVRLLQMQMYANTYDNRGSQDNLIGGTSSNFALILSALLDSSNAGTGLAGGGVSSFNIERPVTVKTVAPLLYRKTSAGADNVSPSKGLEKIIENTAAKFGIEPGLLKAVAKVESDFNPLALSRAGAMGIMQLMPDTASAMGVKNPFDVVENLEGGARYLKSLLSRYKGDVKLALAAYNAGPGAVDRHGGVPPYNETVSYLNKINNIFSIF